jgi:hypothetical protein
MSLFNRGVCGRTTFRLPVFVLLDTSCVLQTFSSFSLESPQTYKMTAGSRGSVLKRKRTQMEPKSGLAAAPGEPQAIDDRTGQKLARKLQELLRDAEKNEATPLLSKDVVRQGPPRELSLDAQTEALRAQWKRVHRLARQRLGYRRLPDPTEDVEHERRLAQIATRGTVQLFNLIHQRRAAEAKERDDETVARRARLLKTREASLQASLSAPMPLEDIDAVCGWSAFSEGFLLADNGQGSPASTSTTSSLSAAAASDKEESSTS